MILTGQKFQPYLDAFGSQAAPSAISKDAPSGLIEVGGVHGVRIIPAGTDANNETFTLGVYAADQLDEDTWITHLLHSATCTLASGITVPETRLLPAGTFFCDTVALAARAVTQMGQLLEEFWTGQVYNSQAAADGIPVSAGVFDHSPADDANIGELWVRTGGIENIVLSLVLGGSAASAQAFVRPF